MSADNSNGECGQSVAPHVIITVTDRDNFKVSVTGEFTSLDYALNMIDQARRELEAQWRLNRAQLHLQKAADAQLAADLMRKR